MAIAKHRQIAAMQRSSLKSHGSMRAQREFELKDGAKRRRLRRWPKAILDFKFSLRCGRPCDLRENPLPLESHHRSQMALRSVPRVRFQWVVGDSTADYIRLIISPKRSRTHGP